MNLVHFLVAGFEVPAFYSSLTSYNLNLFKKKSFTKLLAKNPTLVCLAQNRKISLKLLLDSGQKASHFNKSIISFNKIVVIGQDSIGTFIM